MRGPARQSWPPLHLPGQAHGGGLWRGPEEGPGQGKSLRRARRWLAVREEPGEKSPRGPIGDR